MSCSLDSVVVFSILSFLHNSNDVCSNNASFYFEFTGDFSLHVTSFQP